MAGESPAIFGSSYFSRTSFPEQLWNHLLNLESQVRKMGWSGCAGARRRNDDRIVAGGCAGERVVVAACESQGPGQNGNREDGSHLTLGTLCSSSCQEKGQSAESEHESPRASHRRSIAERTGLEGLGRAYGSRFRRADGQHSRERHTTGGLN